jgi:hypothetical protein
MNNFRRLIIFPLGLCLLLQLAYLITGKLKKKDFALGQNPCSDGEITFILPG